LFGREFENMNTLDYICNSFSKWKVRVRVDVLKNERQGKYRSGGREINRRDFSRKERGKWIDFRRKKR